MKEIGVRPRFCKGNQNCSLKHVNGGLSPISLGEYKKWKSWNSPN